MNVIADTDLRFPHLRPTLGWPVGVHRDAPVGFDRLRYVAWVDAGRRHQPDSRPELAPRTALHVVRCRNGHGGGS